MSNRGKNGHVAKVEASRRQGKESETVVSDKGLRLCFGDLPLVWRTLLNRIS